jgi:hypothetical protein
VLSLIIFSNKLGIDHYINKITHKIDALKFWVMIWSLFSLSNMMIFRAPVDGAKTMVQVYMEEKASS